MKTYLNMISGFVTNIRGRSERSFVVGYGNGTVKHFSSFSRDDSVIITANNVSETSKQCI